MGIEPTDPRLRVRPPVLKTGRLAQKMANPLPFSPLPLERREDFVTAHRTPWLGGYVRHGRTGPVYVLERKIGGVHFHVSTRRRTEKAALKELERFERDPHAYRALDESTAPLTITAELLARYRTYLRTEKQDSVEWTSNVIRLLARWREDLAGADLRKLKTVQLRDILDARRTSRRHRIEAIKGFCAWLRKQRELLPIGQDPTLALLVPQVEPAKHHRRRAVPLDYVALVLPHLPPETQDVLRLQTGTAWHISEVRRFAESGEIVPHAGGKPLAVLVTLHKSGDLTRTPVTTAEHLAAAQRVRARGRIPIRETLVNQMRRACDGVRAGQLAAGVPADQLMPHWRLGVARHSVLTHAVQHGATPAEAAEFAGHRSSVTTKRFYIDLAVPTVTVPVLQLVAEER
jgi:hypothetical protein